MKTILIAGAAGDVGTHLRRELADKYVLKVSDLRTLKKINKEERFFRADISKLADALRITKGVDAVVHFGGYKPRDRLIDATRHRPPRLSEARRPLWRVQGLRRSARQSVCRQVLDGRFLHTHRQRESSAHCIDKRRLSIWISPRDLAQLITIGIEHPAIGFEIVDGVSGNTRSWYDNSNAYRLGYKPKDDAERYAREVLAREPSDIDPTAEKYQGGIFTVVEDVRTPRRCRRSQQESEQRNECPQTRTEVASRHDR